MEKSSEIKALEIGVNADEYDQTVFTDKEYRILKTKNHTLYFVRTVSGQYEYSHFKINL